MSKRRTGREENSNITIQSGPEAYELLEELGEGASSTVYLGLCTRGRLKDRFVALKKIHPPSLDSKSQIAHIESSTAVHQSLHHPSIVSLHSTFTTKDGQYYVLELCANGTLAEFLSRRSPPVLSEEELRPVTKQLIEALIYLRKERVLHRDIKAGNILLTDDMRVKLSDFGLSQRLPSLFATANTFCGSPNYVSPEIVQRKPYSFPTDLWSVGCLILTCLSGQPPFEAESVSDVFKNIQQASYVLPRYISNEAKSLIQSLLQIDPRDRIPLHDILDHPFFDSSLVAKPLAISDSHKRPLSIPVERSSLIAGRLGQSSTGPNSKKMRRMRPSEPSPPRIHDTAPIERRAAIISASDSIRISKDYSRPKPTGRMNPISRRVASAPVSRPQPGDTSGPHSLAADFAALGLKLRPARSHARSYSIDLASILPAPNSSFHPLTDSFAREAQKMSFSPRPMVTRHRPAVTGSPAEASAIESEDANITEEAPTLRQPPMKEDDQRRQLHKLLGVSATRRVPSSYPYRRGQGSRELARDHTPETKHPPKSGKEVSSRRAAVPEMDEPTDAPHSRQTTSSSTQVPIGITRPHWFSTSALKTQTHKLTSGTLSITPSRALLVDFRESERRRGARGDEVLLVRTKERVVEVHEAPHLSTPCCLAEPTAVYNNPGEMPKRLWKVWADAERIVEKLKARTPKMVMHEHYGRCTLMSNEPEADIEVLLGAELPAARMKTTGHAKTAPTTEHSSAGASMRVRVSRKQEVVEIARYVCTYAASDKTGRRQGEWVKKVIHLHQILDNEVARSINLDQAEWDGINKTFEFMAICHTIESGMYSTSPSGKDDVANTKSIPGSTKGRGSRMASTATLGSRESLTLRVASDQHLNQHPEDPSASLDHLITSLEDIRVRVAASSVNTAMDEQFIQTRFLADVGWCLRYGMRGLRYRLMFLDGMTMEIDVEKEHVEFMNRRGEVVRHDIRECATGRDVSDRLEAFEKFVIRFEQD